VKSLPEKPPLDLDQILGEFTHSALDDATLRSDAAEYNRRYLYWDELKYRIKDTERRKMVWALMKFIRMMRFEHVPYRSLPMVYTLTPTIIRSLHEFDQYLSGTIRIHNKTIRLEQSYIINSLMEEAIASSILEGAATTRIHAKKMLRRGQKPKTEGEQMVINNYEAMKFILAHKDEPLTPELMLDIHRLVTRETIDDLHVGRFRTSNDIVVGDPVSGVVYHQPPDYAQIAALIEELCTFANDDEEAGPAADTYVHPIIKGIILHYLIGDIHPFNDGNGRTARTIFYWYVLSRGYWLFEYMSISRIILRSKKKYALAYLYTEYDDMDLTYFINFNITCITEALHDLLAYLERKQTEQNATKAIIKEIRDINARQAAILRSMMEHSDEFFTIRELMQMFDVVYQTARTDLIHLADLGFLIQEKRGREFIFIFNEKCSLWNEAADGENRHKSQSVLEDFRTGSGNRRPE